MKNYFTRFTKYLLDFMFFAGIAVTASLPFSISFYGRFNSFFHTYYWELVILFFISGILAVLILGNLRKMLQTVLNDDCFVNENVISLKRMGTYSFLIVVVTCCRLFLYLTPAVLVVIITFLIAGLFSKVLASVFEKAIAYKQENDLTI